VWLTLGGRWMKQCDTRLCRHASGVGAVTGWTRETLVGLVAVLGLLALVVAIAATRVVLQRRLVDPLTTTTTSRADLGLNAVGARGGCVVHGGGR
jgi:hypothetical protein